MTPEKRSSLENAIWLCAACSDIVDSDDRKYPVEMLIEWRDRAERAAYAELTRGQAEGFAALSQQLANIQQAVDRQVWQRQASAIEALQGFIAELETINPGIHVVGRTVATGTAFEVSLRPGASPLPLGTLSFPDTPEGQRGAQKFRTMMDTGRVVELFHGEFVWKAKLRGLQNHNTDAVEDRLILQPKPPSKAVPVRLDCGDDQGSASISYAELRIMRMGAKEVEVKIHASRLNLSLLINLDLENSRGTTDVEFELRDVEAADALMVARFLRVLHGGALLVVSSLESGRSYFRVPWPKADDRVVFLAHLVELLESLVTINGVLGLQLRCPRTVYTSDIRTSKILSVGLIHGEYVEQKAGRISLVAVAGQARRMIDDWRRGATVEVTGDASPPTLLKQVIEVGQVSLEYLDARVTLDVLEERLKNASDDDNIEVDVSYTAIRHRFLRWPAK